MLIFSDKIKLLKYNRDKTKEQTMKSTIILNYMNQYGLFFLALIIFLEYLNLPGFPSEIILPVTGIWAANTEASFFVVLAISTLSAIIASWLLYGVGLYSGEWILDKYTSKFPKQKDTIDKQMAYLRKKGNLGVFISKLIPMVRTIISIPAGVLKLDFIQYTLYSAMGIIIWNGVLIASGYFGGYEILNKLFS